MQQNEPSLTVEPEAMLSPAEFSTAIVHLYRAQSAKADSWRARLDATTNWAVVTTAAAITFALGGTEPQRRRTIPLISIHPNPISSVGQIVDRAGLGPIPGWVMICCGVLFNGSMLAIAFITSSLQSASGEIMTQHETRERIRRTTAPSPKSR